MNLRELSELLGVSQTTVSRALNGYPEVNEATRERVLAAARQHNYRPNSSAQGLATGRANAIAHILPMRADYEMINPIFADFIAGAGEVYAKRGYDMMLSVVRTDDEVAVYRELAAKQTVDGILVHAPTSNDPRISLLSQIGLPFVVHGRASETDLPYSWLDTDNSRAFQRGTEFLLDLGHRKIALLNGRDTMDFARRRREGYLRALAGFGVEARKDLIHSEEMTEYYGYESACDLLHSADPPTAFLTSSLITAIGVRRACQEDGRVLGRDISIVTHDDDLSYFRNGRTAPYFTALRSPVRDHGRRAAEMLLDLIASPDSDPKTHLVEAELRIGQSTGPAPNPHI